MALVLIVGLLPAGAFPALAQDAQDTVDPNYLHASYSEEAITVDGTMDLTDEPAYRRTISLSAGKFSVAWDKGNLYVAAEAAITELTINGVAVELAEDVKEVEVSFAQLGILDLTKTYNFSIKIGTMETAWNAALIFDANVLTKYSGSFNKLWDAEVLEDGSALLDSYYVAGEEEATAGNRAYDAAYSTGNKMDMAVSYDAPTVVELSFVIGQLPEITGTPVTYGRLTSRSATKSAMLITVADNNHPGNTGNTLLTLLYNKSGTLYLACPDNAKEDLHEFEVGAYAANAGYHLRMEYSYREVEGVTVADVAYYIDGKFVGKATDVYKSNYNTRTGAKNNIWVFTYGADGTDSEKRAVVTLESMFATHANAELETYKADYAEAAKAAKAVEELIDNIDEVVTLDSEAAIINARNAYSGLSDAAKAMVPNLSKLEDAEAQLSKLRSGYLHAMFATTAMTLDGKASEAAYTRAVWLSKSMKLALAWNHDSLYLVFTDTDTPDVSNLAINNMTVDVSSNSVTTNGVCEIRVPLESLAITDISKLYTVSFQVGDITWVGNIVFDTTAFEALDVTAPTQGGARSEDKKTVSITDPEKRSSTYVHMDSALLASTAMATVVEFDLQINNLYADTSAYNCNYPYVGKGVNIQVLDDLVTKNADGNTDQAFKFGFFLRDGVIQLGHATNGAHEFVAIDDDGSGKFHVRVEYTYNDDTDKTVSAEYYINDVLVATGENVRVNTGSVGTTGKQRVFLKADAGELDLVWSNVSVSQTDPALYEGFADVAHVVSLINAIGTVTVESESLIEAARTAYEALADEQKPYVTNLDVLEDAETEIQSLQNAAQTVIDLIAALPAVGVLDLDDKAQVSTARTRYNRLTDKQKALVTNLDVLEAAEAEIKRLQAIADAGAEDQAAADAVIALINAIGTVTAQSDDAIRTADYEFSKLTETQKALVTNQDTLIAARAAYYALLAPIEYESPENVDAAFSTAAITIDGVLKEEGWRMSGRVLDGSKKLYAEYAFQWDQSYLYVAVDFAQDVTALTLTLNGKTFTVKNGSLSTGNWLDRFYVTYKVNGDIVEMRIPMSRLNMGSKVSAYGKSMAMSVKVGSYTGNGKTLHLSNIDWFVTESRDHRAPYVGITSNDAYHGVQKLENGYRLYDLFGGTNGAKIRSVVQFSGKSGGYRENLGDRVYDTRIEFDFQAHAMPVLPTDGTAYNSNGGMYGCSGFTCCAGEIRGADNYGLSFNYGIINTVDGLVFVLNISGDVQTHILNKAVGDKFSLAVEWTKEDVLNLFVDGVQVNTFRCGGHWSNNAGTGSLVINMRPMFAPKSAADNYDVSVTNLAFGNVHKETGILAQIGYDDICGESQTQNSIISDLTLPTSITNGQLDTSYTITWTSSNPAVISNTGVVTRPETGMKGVTLTATLSNGEFKYFNLIVLGTSIVNDGVLHVVNDTDPATGVGITYSGLGFTFDATNNSIIRDLNGKQTVNFVVLKDADDKAELTPETMTLWISDDNVTYTRVKDYKLLQAGELWYLYDFEAEGRYIKVHHTKPDNYIKPDDSTTPDDDTGLEDDTFFDDETGTDTDTNLALGESSFFGAYGEMIDAGYETVFGGGSATFTQGEYMLTNNTGSDKLDYAWTISKSDLGITGTDASIRIYAGGKLLYHYVSGANVVVRINDLAAGASVKLTVLHSTSADVMDISNKEGVHEVIYGVQNTIISNERWYYLTLPAGTTFPNGDQLDKETIFAMAANRFQTSVDGGKTWTAGKVLNNAPTGKTPVTKFREGGWIYDSKTGRLMYETYVSQGTSHMHTNILASDDGGKKWYLQATLPCSKCTTGDYPYYALSYSDGIELSTNDGAGPNVDFVFPLGALYDDIGTYVCRVAYSRDGGCTWHYSETPITYPSNYGEEGGCSEGWIVERADGVLVLHVRCQDKSATRFKVSYSYDHGLTWTDDNIFTDYYAVNGQAFIRNMEIAGENTILAAWGGNTSLGNHTYHRNPFVFASSANDGETFRNIQNILFRTFEERYERVYTTNTTNVSLVSHSGGDLLFTYRRNRMSDWVITNVEDFDLWFTRTKGAYDSFEKGTLKGEGWNRVLGSVDVSSEIARDKYAMKLGSAAMAIRSIPYLQDGTLSLDIYVTSGSSFTVELQSAHTRYYDSISVPIALRVEGGKLYFNSSATASGEVQEGWNTLTFQLGLSTDEATLSVNGGAAIEVPLKENFDDYICFINIGTAENSTIYVDELLVIEELDADISADDADQMAADQVVAMIKAVNPGDSAAVQAARAAFDRLTQTQKDLVDRRVLANNGETGLAGMVNYYALLCMYEDDVWVVEHLIGAIGEVVLESEAAILAAEEAYAQLIDDQKAQITNYATLTAAREKLNQLKQELADKIAADKAAAKVVDDQIAELPAVGQLVLTDNAAVEAARAAYDDLTDDQVQYVENLSVLEAAEAEIHRLQVIADKVAADKAAAKAVDDQIAELPAVGQLVLTDNAAVEAARAAYGNLTEDQLQYVNNLSVLEAAEAEIDRLQAIADKIESDKAAAKVVDDQIAALPEVGVLTLENMGAVEAAREAYESLTEDEAQHITNLAMLEAAEAEITRLQAEADKIAANKAAAKAVDDQIAELPAVGQLVLTDNAAVEAARAAYDNLTDDQEQYVESLSVLEAAEAEITRLQAEADKIAADKAAAKAVDDQIAALPAVGVLTLENKSAVAAARAAYDDLTDDQVQYVENLSVLEAAEAEIHRLQAIADKITADKAAAKVVDDQIAELPAVGVLTLDNRAAVEAARTAYDALTEDEVHYITNLAILEAAEAEIERLQVTTLYTVKFLNEDGSLYASKTYHWGDTVEIPSNPTKAADKTYIYAFAGWDTEVVNCAGDATYKATYTSTYIDYIVVFQNWDGTELSKKTYHYGEKVTVPPAPTRPNDSKYSYTFTGWNPAVVKCAGNATYTAVYSAKSLVPSTITSSQHTVSGGTISKIGIGTTAGTLLGNLVEGSYAKVYQGNQEVAKSALIGTGMTVKIMDGNTVKATATIVVTGDTNGDGKLSITDMLATKAHLLKKSSLSGASGQAADTNGDGGVSITDFIQMKAHILGKSKVEPKSTVTVVQTSAVSGTPEAEQTPVVATLLGYIQPDAFLPEKKSLICL